MSLVSEKYTMDEGLIKTSTSGGFSAAQFPQIRDAIADKMRSIYGNDIDLSSASADGQYVNAEALVFNNILRTLESVEKSFNPAEATGSKLDILASLMHVNRQYPTRSKITLYIRPLNEIKSPTVFECTDANGNKWMWHVTVDFTNTPSISSFSAGTTYALDFYCATLGAVQGLKGDVSALGTDPDYSLKSTWDKIDALTNKSAIVPIDNRFDYFQPEDAVTGFSEETDSSLRSKMQKQIGMNSVSLLDSLKASLIGTAGIRDAYTYNNLEGDGKVCSDGAVIPFHDIYVALRFKKGVTPAPAEIGRLIYTYMTPGVLTAPKYSDAGTAPTVTCGIISRAIFSLNADYKSYVYYKQCSSFTSFKIVINYNFISVMSLTDTQKALIESIIRSYLDSIEINGQISINKILPLFISADMKPTGVSSYYPTSGELYVNGSTKSVQQYDLPITFVDGYDSDLLFTWGTVNTTDGTVYQTLTINKDEA
jgi:hypothetical protein